MRSFGLALLAPLVLALPRKPIPELSVSEWTHIQSGFVESAKSLGEWSFAKAEEWLGEQSEEPVPAPEQTIWEQLKGDPHSFSRLVKIIEFEGHAKKILDDKDLQITFFAPNNDALEPPEHHHHHHDGDHDHDHDDDLALLEISKSPSLATLSAFLDSRPSFDDDHHHHHDDDDDDDDEKKKHRKEIFRKIAGKVLQYHGLPKAYTAAELAQNSTVETALKAEDSYGGLNRRIKLEKSFVPPSLKINGYAKVLVSDKKAKNGYFHTLNHPLLPPPSIIEEAFLFPDFFSIATSAVQQVGARKYLDWTYDHEASKPGKPEFKGNPLVTFFLPSNSAFGILPPKLKFFLFSPFGERALAKLLQYHAVPSTLLLSEFVYHDKKAKPTPWSVETDLVSDDPSFKREFDVHTALPNATLHIEAEKSKFLPIEGAVKVTLKVNGQTAEAIDIPARNGAFHVIGKVLVPPHHHHDHDGEDVAAYDDWNNWESWFPVWANEA